MDKSRQRMVQALLVVIATCVTAMLATSQPADAAHRLFTISFAVLAYGFLILIGFIVRKRI